MSTFHKRSRDLEAEVERLKKAIGVELKANERAWDEVERLRALCLEAAGFIGLRSGPEVDKEADTMRDRLIKAGEGKEA